MMRFLDEAVITVKSGDGGRGCISFRREKYVPRGGPDGGDGGQGGSVVFKASNRLHTLIDFNSRKFYKARNGEPGRGKNQSGKNGQNIVIEVPLGTLVYDLDTKEELADFIHDHQEFVALRGGKGGKGNQHYATPTNRAPRFAQPGLPGGERRLRLSLKYLADIGIIGLPNAGKSTLLSRLTMARPKIEDYPFSTLNPNLGVMTLESDMTLTVADIPGLIEGASRGRGLGHRFLKHIERTRLLVHLIDVSTASPERLLDDFDVLKNELRQYDESLLRKEEVVVINKIDLLSEKQVVGHIRKSMEEKGTQCLAVSALTGEGIDDLRRILVEKFENDDGKRL